MLAQYYNIEVIAVAPYDYISDGNATNPTAPPVLHATVVQHNKWNFDASNHNIHLSADTHESELLEGRDEEEGRRKGKRREMGGGESRGELGEKGTE